MCICSAHVCVHTHITYYSSCSLLGLTLSAKPQTTRSVHYTITALCMRVYIYMDVYMCMCVCVRREMKNTTLIRCLQVVNCGKGRGTNYIIASQHCIKYK